MVFEYLSYEDQYMRIIADIMNAKECKNERTGAITRRLPNRVISVDLQKEFPVLRSKRVYWKSAIEEILWIMRDQSNNIKDLRPHIWDQWADENGCIGNAYGAQVAKEVRVMQNGELKVYDNQVKYVLDTLKEDPSDRRCAINLWDCEDLADMRLTPCCFASVFNIIDGKLNCTLTQRSGDFPVGVPFNTTQYAALTVLFARHLGVEPGLVTHVITDAHIYEDQMDGVNEMIKNYISMNEECFMDFANLKMATDDVKKRGITKEQIEEIKNSRPRLVINSDKTSFWDADINTMEMADYKSFPEIKFNVTK